MQTKCFNFFAARRVGFFFLAFWICVLQPLGVFGAEGAWAAAEAPPEESRVGAVLLMNVENQRTLYEKNADRVIYPTSAVKIMTGLLAVRDLEGRLEERITVTSAMLAGASGRSMGLVPGEEIGIYDLLMAAICGSYNDAACVVASLAAGSTEAFVERMNREAQRLGAVHTVYQNVTGLHDPGMVTTARDTALVAREALEEPLFMEMASTYVHTIPAGDGGKERTMTNRNALVSDTGGQYYNGWCRGMNAGMTDEGGWCVITLWEKNGAANLSVVMQGADVAVGESIPAYTYTNRLLSWAGRAYGYRTVLTADRVLDTLPVAMTGTSKSKTDVLIPEDLKAYLPTHLELAETVTLTYFLLGDGLEAPLTEGQVVGHVTVTYDGEVIATSPLVVMENFSKNGFLRTLTGFRQYLTGRSFLLAVIIFAILLAVYLKFTVGPGGRYTSRQARRKTKNVDQRFRLRRRKRWMFWKKT